MISKANYYLEFCSFLRVNEYFEGSIGGSKENYNNYFNSSKGVIRGLVKITFMRFGVFILLLYANSISKVGEFIHFPSPLF